MGEKKKSAQCKIVQDQFEKLCTMCCTRDEICDFFMVSSNSLIRWCKNVYGTDFETIYKQKSCNAKISLRRNQLKLSEKYPAMAIFLGKQMLGQRDIVEIDKTEDQVTEEDTNLLKALQGRKIEGVDDDEQTPVQ